MAAPLSRVSPLTEGRIANRRSALVWVILGLAAVALLYFVVIPVLTAAR